MNILNKFLLITLFGLFSFYFYVNAEWNTCEYRSQIDECIAAQETWKQKSIEDFVCTNWNDAKVMYQVILDMEFKKLDKQMDQYLDNLEKVKNRYFWIWATKNYIDWINDVNDKAEEFRQKYKELCSNIILQKAISCSSDIKENRSVPNKEAIKYFNSKTDGTCWNLVDTKIFIFTDVAFNILMLNKLQIKADEKKTYDQTQRWNYDHLLDIMMINLWYIERIWQKWPSKLLNPMQ